MTMLHYGVLLKRSGSLSHEDFLKTWLGAHKELAQGLPGLVTARFLPGTEVSGFPLVYDGLGLLSFGSAQEALDAFAQGPERSFVRTRPHLLGATKPSASSSPTHLEPGPP